MKKVFIILLFLSGCSYSEASTKMTIYTVDEKFLEYKMYTISKLRDHSIRHPNCILNHLKIEELYIQSKSMDESYLAKCYPNELDNTMYVNRKIIWNEKKAFITIIHEALHIKFICKPDSIYTGQSLCRLWGNDVYTSQDISNHLEVHLFKELNK